MGMLYAVLGSMINVASGKNVMLAPDTARLRLWICTSDSAPVRSTRVSEIW
jgi:hypothetical protein